MVGMFHWIDVQKAETIAGRQIVLFGAGKGCEELIVYARELPKPAEILFIVDNDKSLHGKQLLGYRVFSPEKLTQIQKALIVVTSVSGRDAIATQLTGMGFDGDTDFLLLGKYPEHTFHSHFQCIDQHLGPVKGQVLHIGPGGFLGLETLLVSREEDCWITSIDNHSFGIEYPDVSKKLKDYDRVKAACQSLPALRDSPGVFKRFDHLFHKKNDRVLIDQTKIDYRFPMDVCNMEFEDGFFDFVFSFAVLEHVRWPEQAVSEIFRVMKKGGACLHQIITTDHRAFSAFQEFGPFSFRVYSAEAWDAVIKDKFYQNRILPVEWKTLFGHEGFEIIRYDVEKNVELDEQAIAVFDHSFLNFSSRELGEQDCIIVARKT